MGLKEWWQWHFGERPKAYTYGDWIDDLASVVDERSGVPPKEWLEEYNARRMRELTSRQKNRSTDR